jgi:hypothetical protein
MQPKLSFHRFKGLKAGHTARLRVQRPHASPDLPFILSKDLKAGSISRLRGQCPHASPSFPIIRSKNLQAGTSPAFGNSARMQPKPSFHQLKEPQSGCCLPPPSTVPARSSKLFFHRFKDLKAGTPPAFGSGGCTQLQAFPSSTQRTSKRGTHPAPRNSARMRLQAFPSFVQRTSRRAHRPSFGTVPACSPKLLFHRFREPQSGQYRPPWTRRRHAA